MQNKSLNKDKLIIIFFVLVGIMIFAVLGSKIYVDFFKNSVSQNSELARLDLYGYTLDKSDTDLYKNNFKELEDALSEKNINYEKYASLLSKLYIIDFYTLNNKISSTDIGALEFIYPEAEDNFKLKAKDTLYKYIEVNFDVKRKQELPEVKEVTIGDVIESSYTYKDKTYEAYKINCNWSYLKDLGYQNSATLTIIKDGTKLYIVESE